MGTWFSDEYAVAGLRAKVNLKVFPNLNDSPTKTIL